MKQGSGYLPPHLRAPRRAAEVLPFVRATFKRPGGPRRASSQLGARHEVLAPGASLAWPIQREIDEVQAVHVL